MVRLAPGQGRIEQVRSGQSVLAVHVLPGKKVKKFSNKQSRPNVSLTELGKVALVQGRDISRTSVEGCPMHKEERRSAGPLRNDKRKSARPPPRASIREN
jgi:hypothetical protein